jgi:hypothetical protein
LKAADITNIDEEEVISKLSNMKVETLNTETSEKASHWVLSNFLNAFLWSQ